MRKFFEYFLALVLVMIIFASCCGSNDDGEVNLPLVTQIQVTPASAKVAVGTTGVLRATAYLSDDSFIDVTEDATWTSSDESIVQVENDTGYAHALSAGTATIIALYYDKLATSIISVTTASLERIDVTPIDESVSKYIAVQYTATGYFSDDSEQDLTPFVIWYSSDNAIATITANGLAISVAAGTTTIEATYAGVFDWTTLEVTAAKLSFLKISPESADVAVGTSGYITVTAYLSDDTERDVTFSSTLTSSDDEIATINSSGFVKALSVGTTTITATFGDESVNADITVTPATLERIEIFPYRETIQNGRTVQFTARGYFSDYTVQDIANTVTWKCNDTVATIESGANGGFATAVGLGDTVIEATQDGVIGYGTLHVIAVE